MRAASVDAPHHPWRGGACAAPGQTAEAALTGKRIGENKAAAVGHAALHGATPLSRNVYKLPLFETLVRRAMLTAVASQMIRGSHARITACDFSFADRSRTMQTPLEIEFQGMSGTPEIENAIEKHVAELEQRWGGIAAVSPKSDQVF